MNNYRMSEADESQNETSGTASNSGRGWAIAGIVCGVLALGFPIIGIIGMVLGIVARRKGAGALSIVAIVAAVVGMVIGFIFGLLFVGAFAGGGTAAALLPTP